MDIFSTTDDAVSESPVGRSKSTLEVYAYLSTSQARIKTKGKKKQPRMTRITLILTDLW